MKPRPRGDDGNAVLEFLLLAVVLLVPLVYVMLSAFAVQRAAFAATAAAREAGRAYVVTSSEPSARRAAAVTFGDQLPSGTPASVTFAPAAGAVTVSVTIVVELPLAGRWARVPVTATHVATWDRYR